MGCQALKAIGAFSRRTPTRRTPFTKIRLSLFNEFFGKECSECALVGILFKSTPKNLALLIFDLV